MVVYYRSLILLNQDDDDRLVQVSYTIESRWSWSASQVSRYYCIHMIMIKYYRSLLPHQHDDDRVSGHYTTASTWSRSCISQVSTTVSTWSWSLSRRWCRRWSSTSLITWRRGPCPSCFAWSVYFICTQLFRHILYAHLPITIGSLYRCVCVVRV